MLATLASGASGAAAQFDLNIVGGPLPPGLLPIQSSLFDPVHLPPGYEDGVDVDISFITAAPPTQANWDIFETLASDCVSGRDPALPPSRTDPQPLGARLEFPTSPPTSAARLIWPADMSAAGVGKHCLAIRACDVNTVCRTQYVHLDVKLNPPGTGVEKAFNMHTVTVVEGNDQPVGTRLFVENINIVPPVGPVDLCVTRCPQFPTAVACSSSSPPCGGAPSWVGFQGDSLTWTFQPPYGSRGLWEFGFKHPDLDAGAAPLMSVAVFPADSVRPTAKEAIWAADFGGPYRIPLEAFFKEEEGRNNDLNKAPYFDRGFISGEIEPSSDVDAFIFHVGTTEWHRFTTRRRSAGTNCVFPATLSLYDITDRLPATTLATVIATQTPVATNSATGTNGCAFLENAQLDNQSLYALVVEHRDGGVGYDYVIHHEVFAEEVEEESNASLYSPSLRAEPIFEPGYVGTLSSEEDVDWGWVHLQTGNRLKVLLSRTDGTCAGLEAATVSVTADDGSSLYTDDGDTGTAFTTDASGCPIGVIDVPAFEGGSLLEARYNLAITGADSTYLLTVDRTLTPVPFPPPAFEDDFLDVNNRVNGIREGTCGGLQAFLLDDYAQGAAFFGAFVAVETPANLDCTGFAETYAADAYGICREVNALALNDPEENEWELVRTQFGTIAYTERGDAKNIQVVAMAADTFPGIGGAAGLTGGAPAILGVTYAGEFGNDFYYDPYGECDEQTYPSPVCKGDAIGFEPPTGEPNYCRMNPPKRYREGQRLQFEMTRWNRTPVSPPGNPVIVEVLTCTSGTCTEANPSVSPAYNFATDVLTWDIPHDFLDIGGDVQEVHLKLTYTPGDFSSSGGLGPPAEYRFMFFVEDLPPPGTLEVDTALAAFRLTEPLARIDLDTRAIHRAFQSTPRSAARHASDAAYFQFATNTSLSRVAGFNDRIQVHPQFENGRLTQGSGPPEFEFLIINRGRNPNPAGTADVFLVNVDVDGFGNFTVLPPTGEDTPFRTIPIPAMAAGGEVFLSFRAPTKDLLGVTGAQPWIAASKAFFVTTTVGGDENPSNDIYGPVFVTPARPPQSCVGCVGDPGGGFAGAYSASKDITGVIASMTPEFPKSGDLVSVNVQVQFSGTGFTDDGVIRFYVDQEDAPTGSTTAHQSDTFPTSPTSGTIYGYTFTFTADKPISGLNELPIRVYLDATNQYTEPGSGEANNQLPNNTDSEKVAVENSTPTFPSTPVVDATEDVLWTYEVQVADSDAVDFDRIAIALTGPTGMAFQDVLITCESIPTRKCVVVEWIPVYGDGGDHAVSIEACDGDPVAGGDGGCATQDFTVTVVEVNDDPIFTSGPPVATATEDTLYSHSFTATDEESTTLTWELVTAPSGMVLTPAGDTLSASLTWTPGDAGVGAKSVQVRITDGDGAAITESWTLTTSNINDAPVLETASGADLVASEGTLYTASFTIIDVDNTLASQGQTFDCSASTGPTFLSFSTVGSTCVATGTPTNDETGNQSVVIRVTDSGSPAESDVMGFTLAVSDVVNSTPTFAAVATQGATEDALFVLEISVTDEDLDSPGYTEDLTFTLDGAVTEPTGISLTDNGNSVALSWTPDNEDVGSNTVKVVVTDVRGATSSRTFSVVVTNVNDDPILTDPTNASISEGATYTGTLIATDPDGDTVSYALISGAPTGFSVSTLGAMSSGVTDDAQVGVWTIVVEATDLNGGAGQQSFTLTVNNVEEAPSFAALTDDSVAEDSVYARTIFASDPDPGDSITYSFNTTPPTGMTLGGSNGEVEWDSPADADVGVYTIEITATDENANAVTRTFALTVTNTNDAPVITSSASTTVSEGTAYSYLVVASDDDIDSGDSLTYSATTLPTWMAFNATTRTLNGTPDDDEIGDHAIVLHVEDETGASDDESFTLTVTAVNDAPVLTTIGGSVVDGSPLSFLVNEGATLNIGVLATDVDSSSLTYSIDLNGNAFDSISINGSTGAIAFSPSFDEAGSFLIFVEVTDDSFASDSEPVTLDVTDVNRAPVFAWTPDTTATEDVAHADTASASDPDADTVTFSLTTRPTGMTIGTSSGAIAFAPANGDVGDHSVTVRATDEHGLFSDASYTLTVSNVNDAPVFSTSPTLSVQEESSYSYIATADDDDGDTLTYTAPTLPTWMAFTAGTRTLSGSPDDDEVGVHSVVIRANDGNGGVTNQAFSLTVTAKNDAPTLVAPTPSGTIVATENSATSFTIAATDPDNGSLTYSIVGLPTGATIGSTTGVFNWTPGFDDSGSYPLTLRASDGLLTTTQALTVSVGNTDRAPSVSAPTTQTTDESVTVSFSVTAADADGDTVTLTMLSGPATATFIAGTFNWTPGFADAGASDVIFRATANGATTDATTSITVTQVNQAPSVGVPSVTAATQGVAFSSDLVTTDVDLVDGDILAFSLDDGPSGLVLTKIGNSTARVTWTPSAAQVGTFNVSITATDTDGLDDTRSFDVTVANVNDAPVITSSAPLTVAQDTAYTYSLTTTDADSGLGDIVTRSATTLPVWMTFTPATGALTGTPSNDDVGSHPVVLRAQDTAGSFDLESFSIVVSNVNDAPVIAPVANQSVAEGATVSFSVVATDVDGTGPTLTAIGVPAAATFTTSTVGATTTGTFSWLTTITDGGSYPITFTASDGALSDVESITIAVGNVNQAPTLASIGAVAADENALVAFVVSASDPDVGDTVTLSATPGAPSIFARGATFTAATGAFSWTPGFSDAGVYTVTFAASDGTLSDSEVVTFTVANVNRAPTFIAPTPSGTVAGNENAATAFTVAATDADAESVTLSISGLPTGATFAPATGAFAWTPNFSQAGTYPLTLEASDGATTSTRALTLSITNTDRPPVLVAPTTQAVSEGQLLSFAVTASDSDSDPVTLTMVSGPTGATFVAGTFSWTPGFDETASQGATFRAAANGVNVDATTSITVANVNRAPVLGAPSVTSATQDALMTSTLTATDADLSTGASDVLTFSLQSGPAGASLVPLSATQVRLSWTPSPLEVNPASRSFTVRVSDVAGATDDRTFNVAVANVNDAPVLTTPPATSVNEGDTLTVSLEASDLDTTAGLPETLTFSLVSGPTGMTVDGPSGLVTWTGTDDNPGTTSVTVRVRDVAGDTDDATFSVTVQNVADDPVFDSTPLTSATEDLAYSYVAVASDPDEVVGDTVTLAAPTRPTWAAFNSTSGALTGTPSNDNVGSHPVILTATDAGGRVATQAFTIIVANVNDAPSIASIPTQNVAEGATVSFAVSASDPDGDSVTVTYSTATIPAGTFDGVNFAWATTFDDSGTYIATFTATDGTLTFERDVTIVVGGTNRPPVLNAIADQTVAEGVPLIVDFAATDPDLDTLTFTASAVGSPDVFALGAVFDAPGQQLTWTPSFDDAGVYDVLVSTHDGSLSDAQTFLIIVTDENRAPTFTAVPPASVDEDEALAYTATAIDLDGDALAWTLTQGPAGMTINPTTGALAWTPSNADVGSEDVTVRIDDGSGGVVTQAFTLVVNNVNDAPTFDNPPTVGAIEESVYTYVASASDVDVGATVTLSASTRPGWLSFTPATGILTGIPDDAEVGVHPVVLVATDDTGATATQAFTVTVTPSNDAPTFVAPTPTGTVSVAEGETLFFTLAATDPDGPALTFGASGLPAGAFLDAVTGDFVWTPTFSDAGTYAMTLLADDSLATGASPLTISVTNTDRSPTVSSPANVAGAEGDPLAFNVTAEDPDGDTVTLLAIGAPADATFDGATGNFVWTPDFDAAGTISVTFRATAGGVTVEDSTTITVSNTNRVPSVTSTPPAVASEDTLLTYSVTGSDPDGDTVTIALLSGPANATFDEATETLTWTPSGTQVGTRTFVFRLNDGNNGIVTHTVVVVVSATNDAPVFSSAAIIDATEDVAYLYDAEVFDEDGDVLTFALIVGPASMALDAATGELTWTPVNADVGDHAVEIEVRDPSNEVASQTFTLTVVNVNDPPRIVGGPGPISTPSRVTVVENTLFSWTPTVEDDDAGDTLTLSLIGAPAGMALNAGVVTWTPGASDVGETTFRLRVQDEAGSIVELLVTVDVQNINDAPFFLSDAIDDTVAEDTLWTRSILADDVDVGDVVTFTLVNAPIGMSIEEDAGGFSTVRFLPQDGDVGTHDFIIRATDGAGGSTDQIARLVVTPVNDAPVLSPIDNQAADVDTELRLTLALATPDPDGPVSNFALVSGPPGATVVGAQFIWTPSAAQVGSHAVVVSVTDTIATDIEEFVVVVGGGDLPPSVVVPADMTADEGVLISEPVSIFDPSGGTATVTVDNLPSGAVFEPGPDQFSWVPSFNQSGVYNVVFNASNAAGTTSKTWVITVRDINRAPQLVQTTGEFLATEGINFDDNIGANDLDGDTLSYTVVEGPDGLTIDSTGMFSWVPTFGQLGVHALSVTVSDGRGGQASGTYTLRVDFLDLDDDDLPDTYEVAIGLDPTVDDSAGNPDSDGLVNLDEYREGTDPFVSDAPVAATLLSPAEGARVPTATPTVTYAVGTDPNGFDLGHRVVIRVAATNQVVFQQDDLDVEGSAAVLCTVELIEGEIYEWFVVASSLGGSQSSVRQTFIVDAVNEAPPAPLLVSPFDEASVAVGSPILRAYAGVDPEGETTSVIFALRLTQDGAPLIVTEPVPAPAAGGEVSIQVPELLDDGSIWLWNATAVDSRGLSSEVSGSRRFTVDLGNLPPPTPVLLSPAEGEVVTTPPLELVMTATEDPEGLVVSTIIELDDDPSFTGAFNVTTTNVTDGEVAIVFTEDDFASQPDGTWYWRVTATDGVAYSAPVTGSFVIDWLDEPPTEPVLLSPTDNSLVLETSVVLRASASIDPEGSSVRHRFELTDAAGSSPPLAVIEDVVDLDDGAADLIVTATFDDLIGGTLYGWRVVASDGATEDVPSPLFRFRVDASNERPGAPDLLDPADGAVVDVARPEFRFTEAVDPEGDELTHDFEIWRDDALTYRAENRRAVDGVVEVIPPMLLLNGDYQWRARGRDAIGGGAWTERSITVDAPEDIQDAGPGDAGPVDGGTDAGPVPDGGVVVEPDPSPDEEGPIVVQFPGGDEPTPSGCTCATTSPTDAATWALLLVALVALRRLRRRRAPRDV